MLNELEYAKEHIQDLASKIQFLLDSYIETEDGYFCFPDGDIWVSRYKKEAGSHDKNGRV